jgi:hypothetical protein
MTFGTTGGQAWVEALPTRRSASFTGRTFSRLHILGNRDAIPTIGEIWATSDHAVEAHAHDADELMYVLSGAIEVNGQRLGPNEVIFIPGGTVYGARVLSCEGSRVLRVVLPHAQSSAEEPEYEARTWAGPLTVDGLPDLGAAAAKEDAAG